MMNVCVCVLLWRSSVDRRLKSMWTRYQSLYMWDVSDCAFFLDFFLRSLLCLIELYCCCIVSIELNSVLEFAFTPDPHDMHSLFGANAPNSLLMTMTMIFETHTPKTYIFVFTRLCCVFNLSQATIVLLLGFSVFAQFILFQIFFSFFLFFFLQQFQIHGHVIKNFRRILFSLSISFTFIEHCTLGVFAHTNRTLTNCYWLKQILAHHVWLASNKTPQFQMNAKL